MQNLWFARINVNTTANNRDAHSAVCVTDFFSAIS